MIPFVIKSIICLAILYGFYHLFLQNTKILVFNRFYLLFSLFFTLLISLITVRIKFNINANPNLQTISNTTGTLTQGERIADLSTHMFPLENVLFYCYLVVAAILLLRFALNIFKIVWSIYTSNIVHFQKFRLVLVKEEVQPYSFFSYIFVSRSDYKNGKIAEELIIHEQTHGIQFHSIDILIVEVIKIVLWFNPFIWFCRKAIQLNHEYLADYKVLSLYSLSDYQHTLLNHVFRNNSTYLASNFNYSLTKKRLVMMTKNVSRSKAALIKIAAVPMFLLLAVTMTVSQEVMHKDSLINYQNEWWYPILKKHNIEPGAFNNFGNVFETGSMNSINNRVVTIENAVILFKPEGDEYSIIRSPLVYHDLDKNTLEAEIAEVEVYNIKHNDTQPTAQYTYKKFKYRFDGKGTSWQAFSVKSNSKLKK